MVGTRHQQLHVDPPTYSAITAMPPICMACARFRRNAPGLTCDAFPRGIPRGIFSNQLDHRQRVHGDHGLRFLAGRDDGDEIAAQTMEHAGLSR